MSEALQSKEWIGHKGEVVASQNEFDVIDCQICGFKHSPKQSSMKCQRFQMQPYRLYFQGIKFRISIL